MDITKRNLELLNQIKESKSEDMSTTIHFKNLQIILEFVNNLCFSEEKHKCILCEAETKKCAKVSYAVSTIIIHNKPKTAEELVYLSDDLKKFLKLVFKQIYLLKINNKWICQKCKFNITEDKILVIYNSQIRKNYLKLLNEEW